MVVLLYCSIFKISFTVVFDSFYILSHLFVFVKPFFQIFSNSFFRLVFRLDVTFIYCITFLSVCQALFQHFLIFSFGLFHGSRDSLFILPLSSPFVNTFILLSALFTLSTPYSTCFDIKIIQQTAKNCGKNLKIPLRSFKLLTIN